MAAEQAEPELSSDEISQIVTNNGGLIPLSLVKRLLEDYLQKEWVKPDMNDQELAENEECRHFCWNIIGLDGKFGIEVVQFGRSLDTPIPGSIERQIVGQPIRSPMLITYMGIQYVVIDKNIEYGPEDDLPDENTLWKIGAVCPAPIVTYDWITLARANLFDFGK